MSESRLYGTIEPQVGQAATVLANAYAKQFEGDDLWAALR